MIPANSSIDWKSTIQKIRSVLEESAVPAVEKGFIRKDPFRVLVSTIISLRTKDEITEGASKRLFEFASTPEALSRLDEKVIQKLIFPAGFYRNKAAHLKETARIISTQFNGRVPENMEELLSLPGVGRKTANLVRNLGFSLPGICVDTHVHRISNRNGWVTTRNPHETEKALEQVLPQQFWISINGLLVRFGQKVCTPVSPFCSRCPLCEPESGDGCPRLGIVRSR